MSVLARYSYLVLKLIFIYPQISLVLKPLIWSRGARIRWSSEWVCTILFVWIHLFTRRYIYCRLWRLTRKANSDAVDDSAYETELLHARNIPGYPVMCCEIILTSEKNVSDADLIFNSCDASQKSQSTRQVKIVCAGGDNRVKSFVGTPLYLIDLTIPFSW